MSASRSAGWALNRCATWGTARYTWFRYLQWLLGKHKGSRKRRLIQAKTAIVHNRTRWTAQLAQDGTTVTAYQWLPTPKELPRTRYRMKGRLGFPNPYLDPVLAAADDLITLCRRCHQAAHVATHASTTKHLMESRMQGNLPVQFGERDRRIQAWQQAHGATVPTLR